MKNYFAKPGKKITIEIDSAIGEDQRSKIKDQRSKGIIKTRRPNDYLPRRKKSGFINFYDLGLIKIDNEYVDLPFASVPDLSDYIQFENPVFYNLTDSHALNSFILNIPFADWKTTYKKLGYEEIEKYYIYLLIAGGSHLINPTYENWTQSGLKLPPGSASLAGGGLITEDFDFGTNKITLVPDYNAPPANLPVQATMDVFLMPTIIRSHAESEFFPENQQYPRSRQILNYNFTLFPRRLAEADGTGIYLDTKLNASFVTDGDFYTQQNYTDILSKIEIHKQFPSARHIKIFTSQTGGERTISYPPISEFPPVEISFPRSSFSGSISSTSQRMGTGQSGFLKAVIFSGGGWFYLWS